MALDKAFTTDHRACAVLLRESCRDIVVFRRHCYSCLVLCYYDRIRVPEVIGVLFSPFRNGGLPGCIKNLQRENLWTPGLRDGFCPVAARR